MKKTVVANWKMNPQSLREAEGIFKNVKKKALKLKKVKTIFCVPAVYINRLDSLCKNPMFIGAQNCFFQEKGSWTGKASAKMLKNIGADYIILGHSELRKLGETDENINTKIKLTLRNRLNPIICIGENERDEEGNYFSVLEEQLLSILKGVGSKFSEKIIIAYEPIWAIGKASKKIINSKELLQTVIFIKKILVDKYGVKNLEKIQVLYGGSVNTRNAEDLILNGGIDGFLVGRDSLIPDHFNKISQIVEYSV